MGVLDFAKDVIEGVDKGADVRISTRWTPDINLSLHLPDGRPNIPAPIIRFLKPKVEVRTAAGNFTIAPAGQPTDNLFPVFVAGTAVILALAAYGTLHLIGVLK